MWPFLFRSDHFLIPTYLVINSLAFCLGIYWAFKRSSKLGLSQNSTLDLCLVIMLATFLGARALHIVAEQPDFYKAHPDYILKIWNGGFVYYGGFFLAFYAGYIFCKRRGLKWKAYADMFAPVVAGGYALGRLGCLAAGCCYGLPTDSWFGIVFPSISEAPPGIKLHPTQIYFSLYETLVCLLILTLERKHAFKKGSGNYFALWLLLHALGRGIIEQFRGDFRGHPILNLSLSTWLSGLALIVAFRMLGRTRKNASPSV